MEEVAEENMQVADSADWDSAAVQLAGIGDATIVFRRDGERWEPVLMSAPSAALRARGIHELGLYTLVPLKGPRETKLATQPGSRIGQYGGRIVVHSQDQHAAGQEAENLARQGRKHLLRLRSEEYGWVVVDGEGGPLPLLHLINDARGTGRESNIRFTEQGVAVARRNVPAANLMAAGALTDIAPSELLASYGRDFWRVHETLGQERNPQLVEANVTGDGVSKFFQ